MVFSTVLSQQECEAKLAILTESEGFDDTEALLEAAALDSISPGICTMPNCDYTTDVEPDARGNSCEACGTRTVQSALVLAGII